MVSIWKIIPFVRGYQERIDTVNEAIQKEEIKLAGNLARLSNEKLILFALSCICGKLGGSVGKVIQEEIDKRLQQ